MKRDHLERSPRLYLNEIIESIEKRNLHQKLTRESFVKDRLRIDAVEPTFETSVKPQEF